MRKIDKNLEAQNQIYRGIFRTPLAFLFGGPVGLIANTIFTASKVKDEIEREEKHKEYIESLFVKTVSQKEYLENKKVERINNDNLKNDNINYLKDEFINSEDLSFDDDFCFRYYGNDILRHLPLYQIQLDANCLAIRSRNKRVCL